MQRDELAYESSASLRLAKGPLVGPVLCRVVSIVLARANCPMDRMDDAMLICDALSAHAPTPHRRWPSRLRRERPRRAVRAARRGACRAGRKQAGGGCGAARSGQRVGAYDRRTADRARRGRRQRGAGSGAVLLAAALRMLHPARDYLGTALKLSRPLAGATWYYAEAVSCARGGCFVLRFAGALARLSGGAPFTSSTSSSRARRARTCSMLASSALIRSGASRG